MLTDMSPHDHPHWQSVCSQLRTFPQHVLQAMFDGINTHNIIAGAWTAGSRDACPMLAAHRHGAREYPASYFAKAWDDWVSLHHPMSEGSPVWVGPALASDLQREITAQLTHRALIVKSFECPCCQRTQPVDIHGACLLCSYSEPKITNVDRFVRTPGDAALHGRGYPPNPALQKVQVKQRVMQQRELISV